MTGFTAALATILVFALGASSRHLSQAPPVYAPPPSCSPRYAQCGGQGWTGPECCRDGDVCVFQTEYYSQCSPSMLSPPLSPPVNATCGYRWDQCGGPGWAGPTCCFGDNECEVVNDWFHQCQASEVPAGVAREYETCGGAGWTGPTVCEDLTVCAKLSESKSMCTSIFPAPPAAASPPPATPRPDGCAERYQQCAGLDWSKCCAEGNVCEVQDKYYAQCLPAPVPPGVKRQFENCGGPGREDSPCEPGYKCTAVSSWHSACL
jgi:hypothetical protein